MIDIRKHVFLICVIFLSFSVAYGKEWNITFLPSSSIMYRGEGKVIPESYVNRFEGETSPLYRIEYRQTYNADGYWEFSLWHTGPFGGGNFAVETVPDLNTGGLYQRNKLNVGFTNFFTTYHIPLMDLPIDALVSLSVVRKIFMRKQFIIQGVDLTHVGFDDVNEISAEGIGFGMEGHYGDRYFLRGRAVANYYIQLFDSKTDSSAGQIFQMEGGIGARLGKKVSIEVGGLWQYWFIPSQGNRRVEAPLGANSAVISWNRQETRTNGGYVRFSYTFLGKESQNIH